MARYVIFFWIYLLVLFQIARAHVSSPPIDYCNDVTCPPGEICQTKYCGHHCPPGKFCPQYKKPCGSECVPSSNCTSTEGSVTPIDYCSGVTCPVGEICQTKYCRPYCPPGSLCPQYIKACGHECVPSPTTTTTEGTVTPIDYCSGVTCPLGEICQTKYCRPHCPPGKLCLQYVKACGHECVASPTSTTTEGTVTPIDYCSGVTCPLGEICQTKYCLLHCPPGKFCLQYRKACGHKCVPSPTSTTTEGTVTAIDYCNGVTCPLGEICQTKHCRPHCLPGKPCPRFIRPCGHKCVPSPSSTTTEGNEVTVTSIDYCSGVTCPPGEKCQTKYCRPYCPQGTICPPYPCGSYCVHSSNCTTTEETVTTIDYCSGVTCSPGEICRTKYCRPSCPPGRFCPLYEKPCGSECVPSPSSTTTKGTVTPIDYCSGVTCPPGENCQTKYCRPSCPTGTPCPLYEMACGSECVSSPNSSTTEGTVIPIDYCSGVTCPPGEICRTKYCRPSCPPGRPCPLYAKACGSECVPSPNSTTEGSDISVTPIDYCSGVTCPPGEICKTKYCRPYCPPGSYCPLYIKPCGSECVLSSNCTNDGDSQGNDPCTEAGTPCKPDETCERIDCTPPCPPGKFCTLELKYCPTCVPIKRKWH